MPRCAGGTGSAWLTAGAVVNGNVLRACCHRTPLPECRGDSVPRRGRRSGRRGRAPFPILRRSEERARGATSTHLQMACRYWILLEQPSVIPSSVRDMPESFARIGQGVGGQVTLEWRGTTPSSRCLAGWPTAAGSRRLDLPLNE